VTERRRNILRVRCVLAWAAWLALKAAAEGWRADRRETRDAGHGVRVTVEVSALIASWLSSFGWRHARGRRLCPCCAGGLS